MKHWDSLQVDPERQVGVGRHKALVVDEISACRVPDEVPLVALDVRVGVDGRVVREADIQLEAVVGPRAERAGGHAPRSRGTQMGDHAPSPRSRGTDRKSTSRTSCSIAGCRMESR